MIERSRSIPDKSPEFKPPPVRDQAIALAVALVCAICFLRSAVLPTNAVVPYAPEVMRPARDIALADGASEAEIYRGNLSMGDKYNQSLAWDRITQDRLRNGEIPTWTRDIAGGVSFVPQMGQVYHPVNLLLLLVPSAGVYGIWYLLHLVLLGFFAYRFMRRIEIRHAAAVFGMVALVLGFWAQARIHHNVMLSAVVPVFAMLSCAHHIFRYGGGSRHIGMLGLATGLCWITGFAPASLMCTCLVCAFAVSLWFTTPEGRKFAPLRRFATGIGCGLLLASVQIVPILLAASETSRLPATIETLSRITLEVPHLATLLWPTLFSWPADHFYPGMGLHNAWPALAFLDGELNTVGNFNFPETAFYVGLAPLVFAFGSRRKHAGLFFGGAAILGLAMAQGWLLQVTQFVPGAHSGDVKRCVLLFGICAPILAANGLDRCITERRCKTPVFLALGIGIVSIGLFLFHLSDIQAFYGELAERRYGLPPGAMSEWITGYEDEPAVNRTHLLWLFGVAGAVCLAIVAVAWRPGRFTAPVLCVITAAELTWSGNGTIVPVPTKRVTTPPTILRPVLESERDNGVRPRLQRLMAPTDTNNLDYPVWPNMPSFWGAEDLATYNPLPKARMEEFFLALEPDEKGKRSIALGGTGVGAFRRPESLSHALTDLLGVEWVIATTKLDLPGHVESTPADAGALYLYRRTTCMPRATFVTRAEVLDDLATRLERLSTRGHDPRKVVVLEDPDAPKADSTATTGATEPRIIYHADEEVRIRVENRTAGYLRLADPYDAGWTATVDDEDATIYVADHYFRAVFLAPGDHKVVFRYNGMEVLGAQILTVPVLLLLIALCCMPPRREPEATED